MKSAPEERYIGEKNENPRSSSNSARLQTAVRWLQTFHEIFIIFQIWIEFWTISFFNKKIHFSILFFIFALHLTETF